MDQEAEFDGNLSTGLDQALAEHKAGRHQSAEQLYTRVLAARPSDARAALGLGWLHHETGRGDSAVGLIERALALDPLSAQAYHSHGLVLKSLGRYEEAITSYRAAIELKPDYAIAYYNLGNALAGARNHGDAAEAFRRAIALAPMLIESYCGLGQALAALGRLDQAAQTYKAALDLAPHHPETFNGLGMARMASGDVDGAIACYVKATALDPDFAEAYSNMGVALMALGKDDNAIFCFYRAIGLNRSLVDAHFNLSLALLRGGHLAEGLAEYEWRRRRPEFPRQNFPAPEWSGEPLARRTILLYAEQGYGDAIHFARYATILAAKGATVILAVREPLAKLLTSVPGVAAVVTPGAALPRFDFHLPLMSLPHVLATRMNNIPAPHGYVGADPAVVEAWRHRLGRMPGLTVGLVWAGASGYSVDQRRSIAFDQFNQLADVAGVRFVSLQKHAAGDGPSPGRLPTQDFTAELDDFSATAALVTVLDLVISVDTAVAHLAGALGKPVWILSRFDNDWRWFRDRDDSPWYPSARIFRQPSRGDWASVLADVKRELGTLAATHFSSHVLHG